MSAVKKAVAEYTADHFVDDILAEVYRRECSVPAAVTVVWEQKGERLSRAASQELVCSGAVGRVNDLLSKRRFTAGVAHRVGEGVSVGMRRLAVVPPSPAETVVRYTRLEVRYMGADGCLRPVRKFLLIDVETAIAHMEAEIGGKQVVRDWFITVRDALHKHKIERVSDLPTTVKARLDRDAPFLRGNE